MATENETKQKEEITNLVKNTGTHQILSMAAATAVVPFAIQLVLIIAVCLRTVATHRFLTPSFSSSSSFLAFWLLLYYLVPGTGRPIKL